MLRYKLFAEQGITPARIIELMPLVTNETGAFSLSLSDLQYPLALVQQNIDIEDNNFAMEQSYLNSLRTSLGIQASTAQVNEATMPTMWEVIQQFDPSIDLYGIEPMGNAFVRDG